MHAQRHAGVVAYCEDGVPVAGVDARQPEPGGELAEAERAHAALGVALDLGDGEVDVPQRHQAQRDVHAARRAAPLLDHPVVVRLDAGKPELPVLRLVEGLATEPGERRKRKRPVDPVELEVPDAGFGVVAARAHFVVGGSGERHHRAVELRDVAVRRRRERNRDELLVDVDEPVLEVPGVAPVAVGIFDVRVLGAGVMHEPAPPLALDPRPPLPILRRQPRLPHMGRLHHVVVDADDPRNVHPALPEIF